MLLCQPRPSKSLQVAMAGPLASARPRRALGMADLIRRSRLSAGDPLTVRSAGSARSPTPAIHEALPVREVLEELCQATGYTVCMGALTYRRVTYLHRLYGPGRAQHFINRELRINLSAPLYCTAMGKALLTSLSEAWRRRLLSQIDFIPQGPRSAVSIDELLAELVTLDHRQPSVSDEEFIAGARSIAVCLRRPPDAQRIAIEVTVPADDFTVRELVEQIEPSVKYAAKRIAQIEVS